MVQWFDSYKEVKGAWQEVMSSCLPANLASQHYGQLGWHFFSWSTVWCTGHHEGRNEGQDMLDSGMKSWQLLSTQVEQHFIGHLVLKGRLMIRYILISEVRLVPGRVIHVLQNSPDNPLQLFPRSLLLLQRPPHPLVVLKERDKERSGRVRERKTSRRVERCIEYWALNRKYWTDRTFKRGNSNLFYHLSLVQKYHNNNCLISTLIMSFS